MAASVWSGSINARDHAPMALVKTAKKIPGFSDCAAFALRKKEVMANPAEFPAGDASL